MPRIAIRKTQRAVLTKRETTQYLADRLPSLQKRYEVEEDPTFAWAAYEVARGVRAPVREWVLDYFDRVAVNVCDVGHQRIKGKHVPKALAEAFGFCSGGVDMLQSRRFWPVRERRRFAMNAYSKMANSGFDYSEAVRVYVEMGKTLPQAKRAAAHVHGVEVRTIELALRRYPVSATRSAKRKTP